MCWPVKDRQSMQMAIENEWTNKNLIDKNAHEDKPWVGGIVNKYGQNQPISV